MLVVAQKEVLGPGLGMGQMEGHCLLDRVDGGVLHPLVGDAPLVQVAVGLLLVHGLHASSRAPS